MYQLDFAQSETDEARYATCYMAIVLTQKQIQVAEWDDVIALLKALKSVGLDTGGKILGSELPLYVLREDGGTIKLERSAYKMLLEFVAQPLWRPSATEATKECKTWLEGLKPEAEVAADGKP